MEAKEIIILGEIIESIICVNCDGTEFNADVYEYKGFRAVQVHGVGGRPNDRCKK